MAGATTITIPGISPYATDTISFPDGFQFRFGMSSYNLFSVSRKGWIKLGAKILQPYVSTENDIIVPFGSISFSATNCSYKITGTAPNRKFIIDWTGTHTSIQQVKVQLWLYERTGKIEFIHGGINAFPGAGSYSVFCRTKVLGETAFASVDVMPVPQPPVVSYVSVPDPANNEGIPVKTRYRFEPDTLKPATPSIQFSNVLSGCFTVNILDQSVSESFFTLEKDNGGGNYIFSGRLFSTTTPTTGSLYAYNETTGKPDSLFRYRSYASNGFVNSDTVVTTILTPPASISGIKTIPGDYPTINALLQDAVCKQLGPDLIIELLPSYSFASEGGVVRIKPVLNNNYLHSVTIRPAASATSLVLRNAGANPLFAIDSVSNIHIDGRAGGTGTTNNLTIIQSNTSYPAIAYMNNANGGGVHYVNIEGNSKSNTNGLILFARREPVQTLSYNYGVNNATINNCKIGPPSGFMHKGIVVERGNDITIRENEFFRFFKEAIYYNEGGANSHIVKNRFYQPDFVPATDGANIADGAGTMVFTGIQNNLRVDSNRFGGSSPVWGVGNWKQDLFLTGSNTGFGMIRFEDNIASDGRKVYIRNNEFGNMTVTALRPFYQVYAEGNSVINDNKIGTADSSNSIISDGYQLAIFSSRGNFTSINNNFLSGIRTSNEGGSLIDVFSVDTAQISGNDVGGSDNINANVFHKNASGINLSGIKEMFINKNNIHGISSVIDDVFGIEEERNAVTLVENYGVVDSNIIHHLDAKVEVGGISMRLNTRKSNSVSYNNVYALNSRYNGSAGYMSAIFVSASESLLNTPSIDTGYVRITGNKVYSLDHQVTAPYNQYSLTGIDVVGLKFYISNNMISLGINASGQNADSLELSCTGIDADGATSYIEHNSVYIGGKGNQLNYGIKIYPGFYANGKKNLYLTNNIIQIDRINTTANDNTNYISRSVSNVNSVVANKNIWYSTIDPNINTKLASWKSLCQCDSLSFVVDPKFINPRGNSSSVNLHLQSLNPADSAGIPPVIATPVDFDNDSRNNSSPVDIGADAVTPCAGANNAAINITPSRSYIEICPTDSLTLTATLTGALTQFQWQKNLNNIPGANSISYTVTTTGSYRLVAKTACGNIASPSLLIMKQISNPYANLEIVSTSPFCDSSNIEMRIDHNNFTQNTLQYKWYHKGLLLPGKITDHETIEGVQNSDWIKIEVTDQQSCGNFITKDSIKISNMSTSVRPEIDIISYEDTLYSTTNSDTVFYSLYNAPYGNLSIIYTTPVPPTLHNVISDYRIVFTNVPYTFRFKLAYSLNSDCYYSDTTAEQTIYVTNSVQPVTYTFNGNGNWNVPSNWINNMIPVSPLPFNHSILIAPTGGPCILNVPFIMGIGSHMTVAPNAAFIIQGNLTQTQ